ncbi:MAG: hypothetical protein J5856_04135 [Lachnospiraceae bacterium]|nr:hypothetical protein [Lachnospiraceae bacterium]
MVTKKNIYHYILYVIFALVFFCGIGLYSISIDPVSEDISAIMPMIIRYLIVFVAAGLIAAVFKALIPLIPEKFLPKELPILSKLFEVLIVLFVPVLMIFVRIIALSSVIGLEINNVYYNYAIGESVTLPDTSFASYAYASVCKFLCKFNATAYPIYSFNILLQAGIAVFAYFGLKKALKIRYALLVLLLVAFLPVSYKAISVISPDTLITFLFTGYLFFLFNVIDLNKKGKVSETLHILYYVGLGIFSGFIAMWDILGVSLFVISVSAILMVYNKDAWLKFQNKFVQAAVYSISFFVSLFAFLYLINNNGLRFFDNVFNYIYSFIPKGLSLSLIIPMENRVEGIVIFVFVALGIIAFIRNETDKGLAAVIVLDFVSIFTFIKFNTSSYMFLVNYFYIVFAVIGFFEAPGFSHEVEEEIEKTPVISKSYRTTFQPVENKPSSKETVKTVSVSPQATNKPKEPKTYTIAKQQEEKRVGKNTFENTYTNIVPPAPNRVPINVSDNKENVQRTNVSPENIENSYASPKEDVRIENKIEPAIKVDPEIELKPVINNETVNKFNETKTEETTESPQNTVLYTNDTQNRDKIIPSRRDYKTAHVYKSKEEEVLHDKKVSTEPVSNVATDPSLKATPLIKNPLPVPKPHVTRELSYDVEPEEYDDFDIKDLKGKDYYDI